MFIGLFGLPGAGKGTQAVRLASHLGIPHISTGDMFRDMQQGDGPLAREIKAILASGQLVPDEMVTKLAFERLSQSDCHQGFILDGFPRTKPQAEALQSSPYALNLLISLDVDPEEIIKRLSERRVCSLCGSIFALSSLGNSNVCPKDGARVTQRADDSKEAITTRLAIFEKNLQPVMDFFAQRGLVCHVNGMGEADIVFSRLVAAVCNVGEGC